jgi:hypothetical protein
MPKMDQGVLEGKIETGHSAGMSRLRLLNGQSEFPATESEPLERALRKLAGEIIKCSAGDISNVMNAQTDAQHALIAGGATTQQAAELIDGYVSGLAEELNIPLAGVTASRSR